MLKLKNKPKSLGLHQARIPSAQMGSQAGQPTSAATNRGPKPQPPKSVPPQANDTAGYQPKAR